MFNKALELAKSAHEGQYDKAGKPYVSHPIAVADMVETEDQKIVALLHDVVEDTAITLDDLTKYGFNQAIINAIDAITKRRDEGYEAYIERVMKNDLTLNVKIADITHNKDLSRISNPTEKDFKRVAHYEEVLKQLQEHKANTARTR